MGQRRIDWSQLDPSATVRENAVRLGVSPDTVRHHAWRRGLSLKLDVAGVRHGTSRMYDYHACRCAPCATFARERARRFRDGTLVPAGLAERVVIHCNGGLSLDAAAAREGASRRSVGQLVRFTGGSWVVRERPRPPLAPDLSAGENAERLGLTLGQVRYAARRAGVSLAPGRRGRPPCGTANRYRGGCRCAPCTMANAERVREARRGNSRRGD